MIFLGFGEALAAPEVLWSLVDAGFKVRAFARKGVASSLRHSRYVEANDVTPPEDDSHATIHEIARVIETYRSQRKLLVLLPLDDSAVSIFSEVINHSAASIILAGPLGRQMALALDKRLQIDLATRTGWNVFPTRVVTKNNELLKFDEFPVVLKSAEAVRNANGAVRKGRNWICGDRKELEAAVKLWNENGPLLIQPYIVGVGEGIFGFSTGEGVIAWSAHRRVRMMNPHGSGSSACVSQAPAPELTRTAEAFIREAKWTGLFMIELLRDQSGKLWFMEFNGRTWGSIALARRQGFEYPAWNVRFAINPRWRPTELPSPQAGIVCRNVGRELMHPLFVLKGPKSKALTRWPGFWKSLFEVGRINFRDRFYNWRADDLGVFFSDAFYTLRGNIFKKRNRA